MAHAGGLRDDDGRGIGQARNRSGYQAGAEKATTRQGEGGEDCAAVEAQMNRCPSCTSTYCPIPPDGPMDADVYLVGERPGQYEEANARKGFTGYGGLKCFVGPTGDELNGNYLGLAGLSRANVRCANTVRCGSDQNRKPIQKEIDACAGYWLREDLEAVNPKVVILMGATACAIVKDREIDLEVEHGIGYWGNLWDWQGWIVPMY